MYVPHENKYTHIHRHPPCIHFSSLVNQIIHHLSTSMEGCQVEGGVATFIPIRESSRILLDQDLYHTEHCGKKKKNMWSRSRQLSSVDHASYRLKVCTSSQRTNVFVHCLVCTIPCTCLTFSTYCMYVHIPSQSDHRRVYAYDQTYSMSFTARSCETVVRLDTNFNVVQTDKKSNVVHIYI